MINRQSRNVSLTSELEGFINDCLASGDYANASEVVRAALRTLRDGGSAGTPMPAVWPIGGGECGQLIRDHDWASTALGPMDSWSVELRTTVANVVNSPVAKVLMGVVNLTATRANHGAGRVRRSCSGDFRPQVHRR